MMGHLAFYEEDQYRHLRKVLASFLVSDIRSAAFDLFYALGYATPRQLDRLALTPENLTNVFNCPRSLNKEKARGDEWKEIVFLFQLTAQDVTKRGEPVPIHSLASILFFAIELRGKKYNEEVLKDIVYAINYCFVVPVVIVFRYDTRVAIGMAKKRPNKLYNDLDVVEGVDVVADIIAKRPQREHMGFLHSFNYKTICLQESLANLDELYRYWWLQFQGFELIKETVSKPTFDSALDIYYDEVRRLRLLEPEEEFWLLLRIKPKHYTVDDHSQLLKFPYSAFLIRFGQDFPQLWHQLISHWNDCSMREHHIMRALLEDVLVLQKQALVSGTFAFKHITEARAVGNSFLSRLLIRVVTHLYLLPLEKINDMYHLMIHGGARSLGVMMMENTADPGWIHSRGDQLDAMRRTCREELVVRNLRLVISIASKHQYSDLTLADLIQEGNLGLMRAVPKFDLYHETRFSTYATWWIQQSVTRSIAEKGSLIRLPVHLQERNTLVKKTQLELTQQLMREPTAREITAELSLPLSKVEESLLLLQDRYLSLELMIGEDEDSDLATIVGQHDPGFEEVDQQQICGQIQLILENSDLHERELTVLKLRFGLLDGDQRTLEEVSKYYNVTRERIRQIESKAKRKIRGIMQIRLLSLEMFGKRIKF